MIKKGITILLFLISVHVQSQMIPELRFHPDRGRYRNIKDSELGKFGKPYETNDSLIYKETSKIEIYQFNQKVFKEI